ncbi:MAG: hypothetical protein HUJ51_06075 [Eggerthellaceae bacterium]|nr:hypothetical protein [Eggerthellaceae bacterium]
MKENEYIIQIFKLETEIQNLTKLLDKAKNYFNKYLESKEEIANNNSRMQQLKIDFNKELKNAYTNVYLI